MSELNKIINVLRKTIYQFSLKDINVAQLHNVLSKSIVEMITRDWEISRQQNRKQKRALYFSAEFLMGRAIYNNLFCSNLLEEARDILAEEGISLDCFEEIEDQALGNGGLGRLAACYLDSAATHNLPVTGYGIRYGYGMFKQYFDNGFQNEAVDNWRKLGDPWSIRRTADKVLVHFADGDVVAIPWDMPIIGHDTQHIATLRLWEAEPVNEFDFKLFDEGRYDEAVAEKTKAENISRVLYPNDSSDAGRLLRLKQQYFFCSASLQDALNKFEDEITKDVTKFADYITIQLNDTHPTISIPELTRLLMERGLEFEEALKICEKVFNYTNHTVMAEALEKWDISYVKKVNPEIETLIRRINEYYLDRMHEIGISDKRLANLQILQGTTVHMAHMACHCSSHINGVAALHTELLKSDVLHDFYKIYPDKFVNVTNGITQRRWMGVCNPDMSEFITDLLGNKNWLNDLSELEKLKDFVNDDDVIDRFIAIKAKNKHRLNQTIQKRDGQTFNENTIVDVQVKRLHEYKRQFLNILTILEIYFEIKEGSLTDFTPTTFIFGGKSAPGYMKAKAIIKVINAVADLIDNDPVVSKYMKVIFVSNYDVSYAERIMAAADVSEQISTAGKEASGTGNMKLMINGAVTLGTWDGANIEIVNEAGRENNYVFGRTVEELDEIADTYNPRKHYRENPHIRRVLDALINGTLDDNGSGFFEMLYGGMMHKDQYFVFEDFESCLAAKLQCNKDAKDMRAFARKQFMNMASAGNFSSDRAVLEYAEKIWDIKPIDTKCFEEK